MDNLTKIKLKKHFQKEKAKKFWCELCIEVALILISIAVCIADYGTFLLLLKQ